MAMGYCSWVEAGLAECLRNDDDHDDHDDHDHDDDDDDDDDDCLFNT